MRLHVVGDRRAFDDNGGDGPFERRGGIGLLQVPQHQHPRKDQRRRIDLVEALVLGGRPVGGLEDRPAFANIRPRRHAQPADQTRAQVADNVAVEVFGHQHVVQLGLLHQLHAHVVDQPLFELDVAVLRSDRFADGLKQPVRVLHDVGLVDGGDLPPAVRAGIVECEPNDPLAVLDADRLDRQARRLRVGANLPVGGEAVDLADQLGGGPFALGELDAGVEVLAVLADDDQVDILVAAADAGVTLARAKARIQIECLTEQNVDRPKPFADGRRNGGLERDVGIADGLNGGLGHGLALGGHHVQAGRADGPVDGAGAGGLGQGGVDASASDVGQIRPDSVARNQRCSMCCHVRGSLLNSYGNDSACWVTPGPFATVASFTIQG